MTPLKSLPLCFRLNQLNRQFSTTRFVFANNKTLGYKQVARLVPKTLQVCLVENGVATKGIALSSLKVESNQYIKILNVHPQPDAEPQVVVQIAENATTDKKTKKQQQQKPKKAAIKNVQISWGISENDLMGQKRGALESILSRGHIASVTLQPKNRRDPPPTANQVESREKLVAKLTDLLAANGSQIKKPEGSIMTTLTFVYGPKAKAD